MESSCLFSKNRTICCIIYLHLRRWFCFYADTVFMTTAGTGVSNIAIIKTTIPYAIGVIILTAIGFVICGISAMGI